MTKKVKIGELVVDYRVPKGKITEYCVEKYKDFYFLGLVEDICKFKGFNFLTIDWLGTKEVEEYVDERLIRPLTPEEKKNVKK